MPQPKRLESEGTPLMARLRRGPVLLVINDEAHRVGDEPAHQRFEKTAANRRVVGMGCLDRRFGQHRQERGLTGAVPNRTASMKPRYLDRINKIYKMSFVFNLVNLVNLVKKFPDRLRIAAGSGSQATLPPPSPLRTVLATFTAHGSSLAKPLLQSRPFGLRDTNLQPSYRSVYLGLRQSTLQSVAAPIAEAIIICFVK